MKEDYRDSENQKMPQKTKWKKKLILILLLLLLSITCCLLLYLIRVQAPGKPGNLAPDHAPKQTEKNASPLKNETNTEKMHAEEGGGAVGITYSMDIEISIENQNAKLYFANPSKSTADMIIQIIVQDQVLAQSDLILTGRQVDLLELLPGVSERLTVGGYNGKIVVSFYDVQSQEKAKVNTEIPVTVQVTE